MSDTVGGLIDKLFTVDSKMWINQETLHEINRLESFEEFQEQYLATKEKQKHLYDILKKVCDLNMQRNQLMDEIDETLVEMIKESQEGKDLDDGKNIQRKHKTY
jgi:predicted transcriptional regulator